MPDKVEKIVTSGKRVPLDVTTFTPGDINVNAWIAEQSSLHDKDNLNILRVL